MSRITEREKEILKILKNDPMIAQEDLARILGITRSAAAVHISNLIRKGYILGRGYVFNDRSGVLVIGSIYTAVSAVKKGTGESTAEIDIRPGGPAYDISLQLAVQNIPVVPVSIVGRDDYAEIIRDKLNKNGIDTRLVIKQDELPTPARIALSGITRKEEIFDRRAVDLLTPERIPGIDVTINNCGLVIIDSGIPQDTVIYIAELCVSAGIPVCLRCNGEERERYLYRRLEMFDSIIMTQDTAAEICEQKMKTLDDCIEAAQLIFKKSAAKAVIVFPELGAVMTGTEGSVSVPLQPGQGIPDRRAVDIFTAAVVNGIIRSYDYRQSLRLALGSAGQKEG